MPPKIQEMERLSGQTALSGQRQFTKWLSLNPLYARQGNFQDKLEKVRDI